MLVDQIVVGKNKLFSPSPPTFLAHHLIFAWVYLLVGKPVFPVAENPWLAVYNCMLCVTMFLTIGCLTRRWLLPLPIRIDLPSVLISESPSVPVDIPLYIRDILHYRWILEILVVIVSWSSLCTPESWMKFWVDPLSTSTVSSRPRTDPFILRVCRLKVPANAWRLISVVPSSFIANSYIHSSSGGSSHISIK